jgi:hypothetical protein
MFAYAQLPKILYLWVLSSSVGDLQPIFSLWERQ